AVNPSTNVPLASDQRGPGFPRIVHDTVDIGAFEVQGSATTATRIVAVVEPPSTDYVGNGFNFVFTGVTVDKADNGYTIVGTTSGLPSSTTTAFNVVAVTGTKLVMTSPPPSTV